MARIPSTRLLAFTSDACFFPKAETGVLSRPSEIKLEVSVMLIEFAQPVSNLLLSRSL